MSVWFVAMEMFGSLLWKCLVRCYGVALLHAKYACTVLKMLFRIKLDPSNALDLIWNRFVNTKGIKGKNIFQDSTTFWKNFSNPFEVTLTKTAQEEFQKG